MAVSLSKLARSGAIVIATLWAGAAFANAEDAPPPAQAATTPPAAPAEQQQDVKQIKLTEDQVTHFISAQPDLAAIASRIQAAGDKPDPALQAELEKIATKNGFTNFAELDDVAANISIVMAGLDSGTGTFVDPVDALRKERDDVQKDKSIPEADKKQLMDELSEAINTTPQLQYKENVELVKTHRADIERALK